MVHCVFSLGGLYECRVSSQQFPPVVSAATFEGNHKENKTNDDVEKLYIDCSRFNKIPDKLGEVFKNITNLWIMNADLREISMENLRQFPKLEFIDLSYNQLQSLPGDLFQFNRELKEIRFMHNKIQSIGPGLLHKLPELEIFYFGWNQIETLPEDFFKFNKKIKEISFWDNKLKFIGPKLLDRKPELTFVNFGRNPCIDLVYQKFDSRGNVKDAPKKLSEMRKVIKSLESE